MLHKGEKRRVLHHALLIPLVMEAKGEKKPQQVCCRPGDKASVGVGGIGFGVAVGGMKICC